MTILAEENYTIVTKHFIYLLYLLAKFFFLLLIAGILYSSIIFYKDEFNLEIVHNILFPIIILLVNYCFIQLALGVIRYYNKLVIIVRDKFILMDSTLILREDLEIMDLTKVMKIDVEVHGIFASMFGYGHLIMEQQKDEVRVIHFMPNPYRVWQILKENTSYISQGRREVRSFKNWQ